MHYFILILNHRIKSFNRSLKRLANFSYHIIEVTPDNKFLVTTNHDAPNKKLVLVDPAKPGMENWKTLIPEQKETLVKVEYAGGRVICCLPKRCNNKNCYIRPRW